MSLHPPRAGNAYSAPKTTPRFGSRTAPAISPARGQHGTTATGSPTRIAPRSRPPPNSSENFASEPAGQHGVGWRPSSPNLAQPQVDPTHRPPAVPPRSGLRSSTAAPSRTARSGGRTVERRPGARPRRCCGRGCGIRPRYRRPRPSDSDQTRSADSAR